MKYGATCSGRLPAIRRPGYARVSTYGQTLDAQLEQLRAAGCAMVYREKASGARPGTSRPGTRC
jgi:DNA invertase Pin-like site-specific DNA recombinase